MVVRKSKHLRGQATIETALSLPFLIWLLYYTLNAFNYVHSAHIGQKFAAMNLYERLDNRAKFSVDSLADREHGREFMGVQYTDEQGQEPRRNIINSGNRTTLKVRVGICKEPSCR